MAKFLFRIGRDSSRHPLMVIAGWAVALVAAASAYLGFGGSIADSFSIPGTETDRVTQQLSEEIAGIDGATARVVFRTEDGSAFTEEQITQIGIALESLTSIDGVSSVLNPFNSEKQREAQAQTLADGADLVSVARDQLGETSQQLDASQAQLDAAQQQLDAGVADATAAGMYDASAEQFAAQQQQIDDGLTQLSEGRAQLEQARAEVQSQAEQIALGRELTDYASELRTVSQDGSTALGAVTFNVSGMSLSQATKDAVVQTMEDGDVPGVEVDFSADLVTDVGGVLGPGEIGGVVLALIVLIVMMRAILPALQPIVTSLVGVGVGVATALAFSSLVDMQSVTPVLGVMLGLAVGIDYALFIINRHRMQFRTGMSVHESIGLANGTSGNAVVFAGVTVIVALLALNVTGVPFLGVMGSVAALSVAVAVVNALTLTPALLGLMGSRALSRSERATIGAPHHTVAPAKPMRTGRAIASFIVATIALLVIAVPALSMRLGLPDGTQEPEESTQYRAYFAIADSFGEGLNGTMLVTADLPAPVSEDQVLATQAHIAGTLISHHDVAAVAPIAVSEDRGFMAFQVIPTAGPSSVSTTNLVRDLRASSPLDDGTVLGIAGEASGSIDISQKLSDALPLYLAVVVGLSLIILIIVFRSIVVPVLATAGFVLSLLAAFGAVTAVYQWGWLSAVFGVHDPGPVLSFLPIILTGILFGLAMDYQLFITTGMREAYVHGASAREAVVAGVRHGRAVVTAAAIIMAAVFGGFVFSEISMIRPMGLGMASGVLFDAFVVRMVIVPALMHLAGESVWWLPRWLDKILPNVDVEGSQLEREHPIPIVSD
ncbi:MAG: RND transporter [Actinobacteria bacterium HGW-Actinobacteria-8]|nr:MAG: RND transporter [Actinobacteria bacterium HGW-Actinobacteria-8]